VENKHIDKLVERLSSKERELKEKLNRSVSQLEQNEKRIADFK